MNPTRIRLLDLRYLFAYKPLTYTYCTEKMKERLDKGEIVELILDDSTSFQPANTERFEKFLKDEIELTITKNL